MEAVGDKMATTHAEPSVTVSRSQARKLAESESLTAIFKNYRELTTEEQADKWFGIVPKEGQWENGFKRDRHARVVTLP